MAKQDTNPFTNIRLLIAGIIVGIAGAVLASVTINRQIAEATGNTIEVAMLRDELAPDEALSYGKIEWVKVPGIYKDAVEMLIERREFGSYVDLTPYRQMHAGELLRTYDFPYRAGETNIPPAPEGAVRLPLDINSKGDPGATLRPGDLVSLQAVLRFGERSVGTELVPKTVLDRVKVQTINGQDKPAANVKSIQVDIAEQNSELMIYLKHHASGGFYVTVHGKNTFASPLGQEIPPETRRLAAEMQARSRGQE